MDTVNIVQMVLSFALVIGLIFAIAWISKKLQLHNRFQKIESGDARLSVVSSLMIDPRRRLVLIKRDDKEHLVLLGANQDLLIENCDEPSDPSDA